MTEERGSGRWYAVLVSDRTYSMAEEELEGTGRFASRDALYDGSRLRATMEGEIIEDSNE